ncbi:GSCOCG00003629001-RA-CDS, partial [Cotesia congregata]
LDDDNIDHGFEEAENIRNNRDINDEEIYETDSDDDSESSREFDGSSSSEESSASENDTDSDDDMENGLPNNNENLDSPLYESAPLSCGESILSILLLIIRHKLSSVKRMPNDYEDIWDGNVYKSLSENNGFLSSRNNISFTWNTDGISLYKSSKFSIWPFFLTINELPFHLRSQLKNLLVAGFWFGPKKPEANLFMNSFRHNLERIYNGIFVSIPGHQNPVKIRGMIICGTCDLPAKAGFLNMKGHRGIYGCCKCKIKSEKLGNFRIFPYSNALPLRSSAITTQEGQRAFLSGKPIDGVKGPTTLSKIAYNFVENTVVDSMHCIYLGITKKLMSLWFDSKYHSENFSMRDHIAAIDKKIKSI